MAGFPATRWSIVARARSTDAEQARDALGELFTLYWPALYAFCRRSGSPAEQAAEDLQAFFADLLEHSTFAGYDRERGRFRTWLLGALRHHLADGRRSAGATKRGGAAQRLALDTAVAERELATAGDPELDPEAAYARAWARGVLARAEARLAEDARARGSSVEFAALAPVLLASDDTPYAELAARIGKTEGAVKVAIHRLRKRYGELLRHEVADTVVDARDVDAELRELIAAVRRR